METILLPTNYTEADVTAAANGIMDASVLPVEVLARVGQPADLPTAYQEVGTGKAGQYTYIVLHNHEENQTLLYISNLGYFTFSLD